MMPQDGASAMDTGAETPASVAPAAAPAPADSESESAAAPRTFFTVMREATLAVSPLISVLA